MFILYWFSIRKDSHIVDQKEVAEENDANLDSIDAMNFPFE
jgi:hypothetical protein